MAILDQLFGAGIGGIGDLVQKVVGSFKLSPEASNEFAKQIEQHKFDLAQMDATLEGKLQDTASQNIQAEEKSGDKYTSRARPTFLYIMEAILLWNYAAVPMFHGTPIVFPDPLFWLFGSCMLGYTGARTWEKIQTMASQQTPSTTTK